MANSSWSHALIFVSMTGALAGCGTVSDSARSSGPPWKVPEIPASTAASGDRAAPEAERPSGSGKVSKSGKSGSYVVAGRRYRVRETGAGYRENGLASWYGRGFHGRKTASGRIYNMFDLTAAHKSLPLPTYARVTNLENGRSVVVKINDRGPFVGKRVIDVSYAAANQLGMLQKGTAMVEVAVVQPYDIPAGGVAARRIEPPPPASGETRWTALNFGTVGREGAPPAPSSAAPEANAGVRPTGPATEKASSSTPSSAPVRLALTEEQQGPAAALAKTEPNPPAGASDNPGPKATTSSVLPFERTEGQ